MKYVAFSGGFDSTFLMLDYIRRGINVKGFYLKNIDGNPSNQEEELNAVKKSKLPFEIYEFKNTHKNLIDEWKDYEFIPITKALAAFSIIEDVQFSMGIVKGDTTDRQLKERKEKPKILSKIDFPLITYKKKDLFVQAMNNFNEEEFEILNNSFSCNGNSINGEPCKKCGACLQNLHSGLVMLKNLKSKNTPMAKNFIKNLSRNLKN